MVLKSRRAVGRLVALSGFAFIAAMTLTPQPGPPSYRPSLCIFCGDAAVQDIILNIILFVPFGFGMRLAGFGRGRAIIIAACTTITVELLQMHIIAGRDSSLGDVITNTIGGALGVYLSDAWPRWIFPSVRRARGLTWAGTAIWLAIVVATVWGLQRSFPEARVWGRWRPELMQMDSFRGTVLAADAAGYAFPPGGSGDDTAFRARLMSDSVLVRATVIAGPPTQRVAPLLDEADPRKTEVFLLGQRGRALEFSMRMNSDRAELRNPVIKLEDVFPARVAPGGVRDTVRVAGGIVRGALVVSASSNRGGTRRDRVALTPGLGWSFLIPWGYALGAATPLLSMLWLGGLLTPIGYWAARTTRVAESIALVGVSAVMGLVVVPLAMHASPAGWIEWVGCALGVAIGLLTGRLGTRRVRGLVCP
ncbi:MAG TPA: VanZ family protein [Gemmatimonadaceae bacterium]|nr:VanZ family protein [Gemmatimonadaceae bacterium]